MVDSFYSHEKIHHRDTENTENTEKHRRRLGLT